MKILELAFTAYPVTELKRARHFYESILGLKATKVFGDEAQAWVEYDLGAATLAIGNGAPDWKPAPGGGCAGLEVEDFEVAMSHLRAAGCKFKLEPIETPVCHMAAIFDPDGNALLIHKRKAS